MTRPTLKLSKTDAAKRQLETAIRLWFHSGDPVSIHTLAAASHQILHDIGKKRGAPTTLRDPTRIRPESLERFRSLINQAENFFKHADRDADDLLDFNPKATEVFILDAVWTYEMLTLELVPVLSVYKMWIYIQEPRFIADADRDAVMQQLKESGINFGQNQKAEFFAFALPWVTKYGIA